MVTAARNLAGAFVHVALLPLSTEEKPTVLKQVASYLIRKKYKEESLAIVSTAVFVPG